MKCPKCKGELRPVWYDPNSMLNREQFDASKAGDYYCTACKSDQARTGYAYFWEHELTPPGVPASGQAERDVPEVAIPCASCEKLQSELAAEKERADGNYASLERIRIKYSDEATAHKSAERENAELKQANRVIQDLFDQMQARAEAAEKELEKSDATLVKTKVLDKFADQCTLENDLREQLAESGRLLAEASRENGEVMEQLCELTKQCSSIPYLQSQLAEARKDSEDSVRMNWVEGFIQSGVLESAFEVDGGIHLTLSAVGAEEVALRDQNSFRAAIDSAIAREGEDAVKPANPAR